MLKISNSVQWSYRQNAILEDFNTSENKLILWNHIYFLQKWKQRKD